MGELKKRNIADEQKDLGLTLIHKLAFSSHNVRMLTEALKSADNGLQTKLTFSKHPKFKNKFILV